MAQKQTPEPDVSYEECSQCGGITTRVVKNFNGILGVSTFCRTCGYSTMKLGRTKKVKQGGYGAYCLFYKESEFQDFGALNEKTTREMLQENIELLAADSTIDVTKTFITLKVGTEILAVFGRIPLGYQEEIERSKEVKDEKIITTEDVEKFFKELNDKKYNN